VLIAFKVLNEFGRRENEHAAIPQVIALHEFLCSLACRGFRAAGSARTASQVWMELGKLALDLELVFFVGNDQQTLWRSTL
jgi:hypothetical protein